MSNLDFNPMKVLMYQDQLKDIKLSNIPLPIMLEIDPVNFCNFSCPWCSSAYHLKNTGKIRIIDKERFKYITDFIDKIKTVQGIYFCGGGEPTLNSNLINFMEQMKQRNIKNYITTNGSTLNHNYKELVENCTWIAISVNAGSEEMWKKNSGSTISWNKYIKGIKILAQYNKDSGKNIEVTFKHVFSPESHHEIIKSYDLAIELGCTNALIKPADMFIYDRLDKDNFYKVWKPHIVENVNEQIGFIRTKSKFEKKIKLDCGGFYGMLDTDKTKHLNFDKCWTCMMCPVFGADGNIYICCVRRSEKIIGKWDDGKILEYWGSEKHKEMLEFDPKKECPFRCKLGMYNQVFQQIYIDNDFSFGHI